MWPFKKKTKQYQTKIIERIEYRSIEQRDLDQRIKEFEKQKHKFDKQKENLINEAKQQLLDTSKKTYEKLLATEFDTFINVQERENFVQMIKHDPYIDLDKLEVPYYNIRKAIRRAHAY